MKQIFISLNRTISYKILLILLSIFLCLLLFPMLYIAKWDVPSVDDYSYGAEVHRAVLAHKSFFEILQIIIEQTKNVYYQWQGSVSAVLLFNLMPASFGSQYYTVVPYAMIFSLSIGIFIFVKEFFKIFAINNNFWIFIAITILIACTQFLPSPVQGFYWYIGSVYYTFFFGISLILYSLILRIVREKRKKRQYLPFFITIFLCIFIAFSNYITALISEILLISLTLFLALNGSPSWKRMLFPLCIFSISFYYNVTAPGNAIRQGTVMEKVTIFQAVIGSFRYAITQILKWNKISVIALYLLLLPLLWKIASGSSFSFRIPWLVTLYSFCLQASMNCPTFYANADLAPGRVENIRYFAMLILFIINIFYWLGWISKGRFRKNGDKILQMRLFYLIFVSAVFLYGLTKIPIYRITSLSAVHSYKVGWIGQYKHVFNQRLKTLEDPDIHDAVLREYPHNKPFVLFFDDISEDVNNWRNISMSNFYNKNSVRLRHHNEPMPDIFEGD